MGQAEFFNQSLRITVMQILRGIGFDRTTPDIIDILTDIYVRHLLLLTSETQSLAQLGGRDEVLIEDITQALVNVGMLKPSNLLDVYEEHYAEDRTAIPFLRWVVGHVTENQRMISRPAALANATNGKVDGVLGGAGRGMSNLGNQKEDENNDDDWLTYHMKKGGKLGSERMFDVTALKPEKVTRSDATVVGPTPDGLFDKLPSQIKKRDEEIRRELFEDEVKDENASGFGNGEYQHFGAQFDSHHSGYGSSGFDF
ncbi:Transcription initiation factor TFIID subunit 3 [Cyberlindnera fabianii]|uniref:Transcription initiation factor TFIID subunit 3 n=1 Tax=Cyberlindnera fabianii TaxID=36022 RepID=A0A1V2LDS4_CYBFA|nr:Transcription initiation factor TFIID subunit 3 [Cyberlindnera fabianii]